MNNKNISCLEDCLMALGSDYPFNMNGSLSTEGQEAFDKLRDILSFMKAVGVTPNYNEDALDRILSDQVY